MTLPPPPQWQRPPARQQITISIDPDLQKQINALADELGASGWRLQKFHLVEFALMPLLRQAGKEVVVAEMVAEPARVMRQVRREMFAVRVRAEIKQALQGTVSAGRAAGLEGLEQAHVVEWCLREISDPYNRQRFVERLAKSEPLM